MTVIGSRDFLSDVGLGLIPGYRAETIAGLNPDIDSGIPEDIWNVGGNISFPVTAATLDIVSSSASDTNAGLGAQAVLVTGLDGALAEISELVVMNGTTIVTTSNSFFRVNGMLVASVGTYGSGTGGANIGTITATHNGTASLISQIEIGVGRAESTLFTIPAGKMGLILDFIGNVDANTPATINFYIRPNSGDVIAPFSPTQEFRLASTIEGFNTLRLPMGSQQTPGTDIWMRGFANTNNTIIEAGYQLLLKDL